jgi:transcriptional regulator with XRE-family HTH domain
LPILNTLGDHIKKRRLELGLYQAQVARILGVTESTITNWEKNRTNPTLRLSPKIVQFLGYDPTPTDLKALHETLLQYRKRRGMSQKELAKQIGIDPATLSSLERNRGRSLPAVLKRVSAFLSSHTSGEPTPHV